MDVDWFSTEESFDEAVFMMTQWANENEITVDEVYTDKSQFEMMVEPFAVWTQSAVHGWS